MLFEAVKQAAAAGLVVALRIHPKSGELELGVTEGEPRVGGRTHARLFEAGEPEQTVALAILETMQNLNPQAARRLRETVTG